MTRLPTEDQYRALLAAVPDPLVVVDADGDRIREVNAALCTLVGADREALRGRDLAALFPADAVGAAREAFADPASPDAVGEGAETDVAVRTADGTERPASLAVRAVAEAPLLVGRLLAGSASGREHHLRRYTTYLGQYHTVTTDAEAPFETKLRELLALVGDHFDYEVGLFVRREADRHEVVEAYAPGVPIFPGDAFDADGTLAAETAGADGPVEVAALTDRTEPRPLVERFGVEVGAFLGLPVRVHGEPYGTLCFYGVAPRDPLSEAERTLVEFVVEWLSYELARQRRERELQRQNERLEEFAGIVSHDLRNPLNTAKGYLDLAAESGDPEDIAKADRALDRMGDMIEDVLALARNGQSVGERTAVDLAAVARRAWETVDTGAATLDVAEDVPAVSADEGRLRELFENLFRNAVEHAGPEVTVEVGPLADEPGFYVADDGPGIDAEDPSRVFEHGYTTSDDGTGFGLAIVRQIAEAHGWTVRAAPNADGGARFEFAVELV